MQKIYVPVQILPTNLSAGITIRWSGCDNNSLAFLQTPASISAFNLSTDRSPSQKYDKDQVASMTTSGSLWWIRLGRTCRTGRILGYAGEGRPRQRLESIQLFFFVEQFFIDGFSRRISLHVFSFFEKTRSTSLIIPYFYSGGKETKGTWRCAAAPGSASCLSNR